uniref:Uncharacterized protein n=1 Tax=Octopus bimaculoides TaxID=37653 RepID=A0A0L8FWP4_OCTBM
MASVKTCENSIAFLSGKQIKLFDIRFNPMKWHLGL